MSISSLPEEIQAEVILNLPVKSILTCKCVCKRWCKLISSHEFNKKHRKLITDQNMNSPGFLVINNSTLFYVEYDFDDEEECYPKPIEELFNLSSLSCFYADEKDIEIIGSCNGLVCLRTYRAFGSLFVCNPITRECVQLPRSLLKGNQGCCWSGYNFGYLSSTDEYKVVRISYKVNSGSKSTAGLLQVYTLGDGRGWRDREITINDVGILMTNQSTISANGAIYWIGLDNIAVFDLMDEKLHFYPKPPHLSSNWINRCVLGVLGGHICLVDAMTRESAGIWLWTKMMNERNGDTFDVKEQDGDYKHFSWIRSEGLTMTMEEGMLTGSTFRPLTRTNDGDIILLYKEKYWNLEMNDVAIRYDPKTSAIKKLGDLGLPILDCGKATIHVNSLISLKSLGEQTVLARS